MIHGVARYIIRDILKISETAILNKFIYIISAFE